MDDDTRDMDGYDEQDTGDVDGGDYYNEEDDCIGDDYADDDWESSYGSSEADSDDYHHLWPDPFEEGTQASSAPRSPTPSMAGEAAVQVPLCGVGLCWQADDADLISDGLKVLCLSRPPHWRDGPPEVRREPSDESRCCYNHSRAAGDFRCCPDDYWAAFHQKVHQPQLSNFLGKGCATQGVRLTD
ncbi:Slc35a3 [Symbiodinium sp. KB8]|nr:Slc35a3 [Symbiodinium sp. KB8]